MDVPWTPRLHVARLALIRERHDMLCGGKRPGKVLDVVSVEPEDELDARNEPQLQKMRD